MQPGRRAGPSWLFAGCVSGQGARCCFQVLSGAVITWQPADGGGIGQPGLIYPVFHRTLRKQQVRIRCRMMSYVFTAKDRFTVCSILHTNGLPVYSYFPTQFCKRVMERTCPYYTAPSQAFRKQPFV